MDLSRSCQVVLNNDNWSRWIYSIEAALRSRGLWCYVDGSKDVTKLEDAQIKAMYEARHLISSSLSNSIHTRIEDCATPDQMMARLRTIFEGGTIEDKFSLLEQFYSLRYEGSMEDLFSSIRKIMQKLRVLGKNMEDEDLVAKVISILPTQFESVKTHHHQPVATERDGT